MYCTNFFEVESWFGLLKTKKITIRRYDSIAIDKICTTPPEVELLHNLKEMLDGTHWNTFWHMKQLMITLKDDDVLLPLVIARPKNLEGSHELHRYVDPGGSRMCAMTYHGKKSMPLDIIWPAANCDELKHLDKHEDILSAQQFLQPYENIKIKYKLLLCSDEPCETCIKNNKQHNNPYRYLVQWSRDWFYATKNYQEDFYKWRKKNIDFKPDNLMDWYKI
jgi:hypothetical protein